MPVNFNAIGYLTKDWETKQTKEGKTYIINSIAVKNSGKNGGTTFLSLPVYSEGQIQVLAQYTSKGSHLAVSGTLEVTSGQNQPTYVNIHMRDFEFLDRKGDNQQSTQMQNNQDGWDTTPTTQAPSDDDFFATIDDTPIEW